jgi:hypothetical protein
VSDAVSGNLTVLMTFSGGIPPGSPLTPENIPVDVYVTPHELREHEDQFPDVMALLVQTFVHKMAIPHAMRFRERGLHWGFINENSNSLTAMPSLPTWNPWPDPPYPLTTCTPTTHQTMTGWPWHEIPPTVVNILHTVFPAISPAVLLPTSDVVSTDQEDSDELDWFKSSAVHAELDAIEHKAL